MIELNKIYNESNLETMARMPDNFIDLTVTSPPYDGLRTYKGYSFPFEDIAKELYRVTKQGGVVVWVVGDAVIDGGESGTSFRQALFFQQVGFLIHDTMIYRKKQCPFPMSNRYNQVFEYMFVFSKGKPKTTNLIKVKTKYDVTELGKKSNHTTRNPDGSQSSMKYEMNKEYKTKDNVWEYGNGIGQTTNDKIAFKHPALFPEQLAEDHIVSWSNEGDLIYDCFGGSGTTAKMAHKWKRNWILSEISKEYVELAEKRLLHYLAQTSLF